ncbi:MAG: hypothetical protein MUE73_02410 [Planctomycetes bacterium]|jgi:hypothetical protein|nr:hypothetical protein [Planctomycetota bacterium]
MVVNTRGSAGVVALALASVVLLGSLWLAFGTSGPAGGTDGAKSAPDDAEGTALMRDADALSRGLSSVTGPVFASDPRFSRTAPGTAVNPAAPAVRNLRGEEEGGAVLLRWDAEGLPATGYLLVRLADDGQSLRVERLGPDARTFRDETLDAVAGSRVYRVTALGPEGILAGAEQRLVRYRLPVSLAYLGSDAEGRARFRVAVAARPPAEFAVAAGDEIGEKRPEMDYRTGSKFAGLRATRQIVTRETDVPEFLPDGRLLRNAESGEVVVAKRAVPVPVVSEGAVVLPPDTPDVERWLPRSKD